MKRAALIIFLLLAFGEMSALTVTYTGITHPTTGAAGATSTTTATYNGITHVLTWSESNNNVDGGYNGACSIWPTDGENGPQNGLDMTFHNGSGSWSGSLIVAPGTWLALGVLSDDGTGWHTIPFHCVGTYAVDLLIPQNDTPHTILYLAMQGGQGRGSYSQPSGGSATTWHITGLVSDTPPVVLVAVTGGFIGGDLGTGGPGGGYPLPNGSPYGPPTLYAPVSPGVTPGLEGGPIPTSGPASPPSSPGTPVNPTPPVDTPTSPTPTTPTVAPTPPVNPSPTGAGAATKEDIMTAANQITDRIHYSADKATEASNNVVAATDKVASAVKDSGTKNVEGINKLLTAADKQNGYLGSLSATSAVNGTKLEGINSSLTGANSRLDAANGKLDTLATKLETGNVSAAATAKNTSDILTEQKKLTTPSNVTGGNFDTAGNLGTANTVAAGSTYGGTKVTGSTVSVTTQGTSDGLLPTATLHVADRDVTLGQLPATFNSALQFLKDSRPFVLLVLVIAFFASCSSTMEAYVVGLGNIGGGGAQNITAVENVVPGVAQAKHLASATAIAAVGFTAVAAIIAVADGIASHYGTGVGAMLTAFNYPSLGNAVAWIDVYFPVAVSTALVILRAAFGYLCAPIYITAATLARFLHV